MEYVFIGLLVVSGLGVLYTSLKIRQLNKFSAYLTAEIDSLYQEDKKYLTHDLDISASYDNYHKAFAWRRDFANMVVYRGR